jgi:hypothetical protein
LSSIVISNAGSGASGSNFYNNSILFNVGGYGGTIGGGLQNNVGGFLSLGTMYGNAAIVSAMTIISANTSNASVGIGQTAPQYILDVNNYNINTQIRIGPRQYVGAAADTTTYGLERSRHEIRFAGYRDTQIDKIGSKIVSINKQTYGGANQQLIQSADLAFFTVPPQTANIDDTVERLRITDSGSVGIGTSAPSNTLHVGFTNSAGGSNETGLVVSNSSGANSAQVRLTSGSAYGWALVAQGTAGGPTSGFSIAQNTSTSAQNQYFNIVSNGSIGIGTTSVAGGSNSLQVTGGLTLGNGYRPLYSNVTSGASLSLSSIAYGTHFNITTSALTAISNGTITQSTDSNAYYVFRNNTGTYLSITFTYVTSGTQPPNPVIIPPANSVTMMYQYTGSSLSYVLF